jgi:hypothetical protein
MSNWRHTPTFFATADFTNSWLSVKMVITHPSAAS